MTMQLSETFNKDILDSLGEGLLTVDKEFKITFFNRAAELITGRKRGEVLGKKCKDVCKSEFCHVECPIIIALNSGKRVFDFESKIQSAAGTLIPVKLNAAILKNAEDEPLGGVVSFREVCLNKQAGSETSEGRFCGIVGHSKAMKDIFSLIKEISHTDASVLIQGETGTGKEMLANAIQANSIRCDKNFVKVNCAVIPPNLLASELFGHAKGAFTDAVRDRIGRFELADKGTIFLDEVTEMSLQMQAQLLRVLQEGTFERLGESVTREVDVRIIAATNREINEAVAAGQFREDLMYRLNVIPIRIPPLRERMDDIPFLVKNFIQKFSVIYDKQIENIDDEALDLLMRYNWPGNIRELENAIEYAFVRAKKNKSICACSLPAFVRENIVCPDDLEAKSARTHVKNSELIQLLIQYNWNKTKVAQILGVNRTTVWRKLKMLGMNR